MDSRCVPKLWLATGDGCGRKGIASYELRIEGKKAQARPRKCRCTASLPASLARSLSNSSITYFSGTVCSSADQIVRLDSMLKSRQKV